MSQAQRRSLQRYHELIRINASSHALRAAMNLGLFDALAAGQKTTAELAKVCETKREPTELLLDVLRSLGVVEKYGDDWALAPVMRLLTQYDRDLGDQHWQHVAEFVRTGQSLAETHTDEAYRASATSTQWTLTPAAMQLATALEIGTRRKGLRILDLGAGSAVWSLAIAHQDVDARVTAIDWAEPLESAQQTAKGIGIDDRLETIPGDWREAPLQESEFDLIIAANLIQLEPDDGVQRLLARLFAAARPGGELAIVDIFPGQTQGELDRALFVLRLALRTTHGRMHAPGDLQSWITEAGFEKPTYTHLPVEPHMLGLMLARKPR